VRTVVQQSRQLGHQLGKQLKCSQGNRTFQQGLALGLPARQPHSHQLGLRSESCLGLEGLVVLEVLVVLEGLVGLGHQPLGKMAAWRLHMCLTLS